MPRQPLLSLLLPPSCLCGLDFWLSFSSSFSRGIWRFSGLTLLGWLALRRRLGAPFLLGAPRGQLQRPLLLFLLPFFFSFFPVPSSPLPSSPFVEKNIYAVTAF